MWHFSSRDLSTVTKNCKKKIDHSICWVPQWLLFSRCKIGLKTFCSHLKLDTLRTFFFWDARVGDWLGESLEGFCGLVQCGFLMVYPCGEDHTVSLKHMPHFRIIKALLGVQTFKGESLEQVSNTRPLNLISNCSENGNHVQVLYCIKKACKSG